MLKLIVNFILGLILKEDQDSTAPSVGIKPEGEWNKFKDITLERYLTADNKYPFRAKSSELTQEIKDNASQLLDKVNALLSDLGVKEVEVNSGWRTAAANEKAGGKKKSNHLLGLAIDIKSTFELKQLFLDNVELLEKHGIFCEDFKYTSTWIHMQCVAPKSGKRFFIP